MFCRENYILTLGSPFIFCFMTIGKMIFLKEFLSLKFESKPLNVEKTPSFNNINRLPYCRGSVRPIFDTKVLRIFEAV